MDIVGKRVLITGDHPWSGYSGVVSKVEKAFGGPGIRVDLDNGISCGVTQKGHMKLLESSTKEGA